MCRTKREVLIILQPKKDGFSFKTSICNGKNGGLLPIFGTCDRYYVCNDGNAVVGTCEENKRFDPNTLRCDDADNVECLFETASNNDNDEGAIIDDLGSESSEEERKVLSAIRPTARPTVMPSKQNNPGTELKKPEGPPIIDESSSEEEEKKVLSFIRPTAGPTVKPDKQKNPGTELKKPVGPPIIDESSSEEEEKKVLSFIRPTAGPTVKPDKQKNPGTELKKPVGPPIIDESSSEEEENKVLSFIRPTAGPTVKPDKQKNPGTELKKPVGPPIIDDSSSEEEEEEQEQEQEQELPALRPTARPTIKPNKQKNPGTELKSPTEASIIDDSDYESSEEEQEEEPLGVPPTARPTNKPTKQKNPGTELNKPESGKKDIKDITKTLCVGEKNGSKWPKIDSCSEFYVCKAKQAQLRQCPDDQHFSATNRTCMLAEEAECSLNLENEKSKPAETAGFCSEEKEEALVPHRNDCSKFLLCSNMLFLVMDCPIGLHFNAELKRCDYPKMAKCEKPKTEKKQKKQKQIKKGRQ
ncbi:sterile alpha motif domain-containing protein 15 [Scaptodrosophila lebanonensis]|uniref:Sterile alpha motif domain-containing protein 15 n=1 Tax=Drosophila lebanonensis TaxID=7225 RepID=A0A6J2TAQ1_DROLE|nr:sterile alpha motif domain-containing protein 15 [Scaptodrosophila lebanonensis]